MLPTVHPSSAALKKDSPEGMPKKVKIFFLRWHYPNQVLRVGAANAPSQPVLTSSPVELSITPYVRCVNKKFV